MKPFMTKFNVLIFFSLLGFIQPVFSQGFIRENVVSVEDSTALMEFYEATQGSTIWSHRVYSWKNKKQVRFYPGVELEKIDGVFRVVGIKLRGTNTYYLKGELPDALSKLPYLRSIEFGGNNFGGELPKSWGKLEHLQLLDLSNNKLFGEVPKEWKKLQKLEFIGLSNNMLEGNPLPVFGHLVKLRQLFLFNNKFDGQVGEDLGKLNNLAALDLGKNEFSGNPFPYLCGMKQLVAFNFSANNFSGEIPDCIVQLQQLQQINVGFNEFSGECLPLLAQLKNLTQLSLVDNNFTGNIPTRIFYLPNLESLDLTQNKFNGSFPELKTPSSLKLLSVARNELSGELPNLSNFSQLKLLDMGHNNFTGEAHKAAVSLPQIMQLDFSDNLELVTRDILQNINAYKHLKHLDLDNTDIDGYIPEFAQPNYILEYIDLDTANLQGNIPPSIRNLLALKEFNCNGCGLTELPDFSNNPSLKELTLIDNYLDFEQIEKNLHKGFNFLYSPQRPRKDSLNLRVFKASKVRLYADVPGADTYQWFKDEEVISGGDAEVYQLEKLKEGGRYTAETASSGVEDLVIKRKPVTIEVLENTFDPKDLPITINAGVGAKATYLWQNGLKDSVTTIREPGEYKLTITIPDNAVIETTIKVEKSWDEVVPEKDAVVELEEIHFQRSRWVLLPESHDELDKLVKYLNKYPEVKIQVMGHTDNTGKERENMILSQNRADAVRDYLIEKGISFKRITAKGYGSKYPKYSNETEETRKLNRRVEFKVL